MSTECFSDQLRRAIDESGMSRYAVCKAIGVHQSTMSKFMNGKGGMSIQALDRMGELLGLHLMVKKPKRRGG
jgi:transcriptional regulator with XRE-family HTH domain